MLKEKAELDAYVTKLQQTLKRQASEEIIKQMRTQQQKKNIAGVQKEQLNALIENRLKLKSQNLMAEG